MTHELFITSTVTIHAPAQKVWDVLTRPEYTQQYMFGCEAISDWRPGSTLLWQMQHEGKDLVAVKGIVVAIHPPAQLVYTVIDPNNPDIEDIPSNYLTVTYKIAEAEGATELTVTQGDYSKVAEGEKRYNEAWNNGEGWNPILVQVKALAESN